MALVIATFIIVAVFVGYHASQESHEKTAEVHGESIGHATLYGQARQTTHVLYITADLSKSSL
ncbi:MAG: hypothetical protein JHC41_09530 [Nitrosopumilus sp.]|jgi:hypothetical protein|nr:hypothetical protein [Nitrosopumilus sp.]